MPNYESYSTCKEESMDDEEVGPRETLGDRCRARTEVEVGTVYSWTKTTKVRNGPDKQEQMHSCKKQLRLEETVSKKSFSCARDAARTDTELGNVYNWVMAEGDNIPGV